MKADKKLKTINSVLLDHAKESIMNTTWITTAPPESRKEIKVRLLGVESRNFSSLMLSCAERPAAIFEVECGGLKAEYTMLIDFPPLQFITEK